jgi:hypothetical protein
MASGASGQVAQVFGTYNSRRPPGQARANNNGTGMAAPALGMPFHRTSEYLRHGNRELPCTPAIQMHHRHNADIQITALMATLP